MTSMAEVVRAGYPGASSEIVEHIVWERTPFPVGPCHARSLFKAASGFYRAGKAGNQLCDFCENVVPDGQWHCAKCEAMLRDAK